MNKDNAVITIEKPKKINFNKKELIKRVVSASFLFPIMIYVIQKGGFIYYIFILLITIVAIIELQIMFDKNEEKSMIKNIFHALSLVLICGTAITMIYLRTINHKIIYLLVINNIVADSSAFFIGKIFQGPKIYPKISPNKTYSGMLGSLLCCGILGLIIGIFSPKIAISQMILYCAVLNITGFLGDLFESKLKRVCGVKDSGFLLPGHGGFLDRIDCFLFSTIVIALYI